MIRLVPGTLATLGSAALCLEIRISYLRHLNTGDQAGFALGVFFLISWFLPVAAAALVIGAILLPLSRAGQDHHPKPGRGIVVVLMACAAFFLVCGVALEVPTWWPSNRSAGDWTHHAFAATIVAFAANVLACALAARMELRGGGGGRWLSGVMLATSAVVLVQIAAFVHESIQEGFLLVYLPFITGPSLIWIAALLRSAWLLRRARSASPQRA